MKPEYFLEASFAIQIHAAAAFVALGLGIAMWLRPKGTRGHKLVGRGFVVVMLLTAISALFIREINNGSFSWIHIFVPITFLGAWQAITRIRRKNVKGHISAVRGMFFGALIIPGIFSFMPGRTLWMVFFS
ncbi:DUF2306 domain-containing protein [Hellea balneolensis]|uniref:DUF2306 domain-containing protein n=1 Tax=Hellea balneolensis TaxID=287478 RepID=UPI00042034A6|nr:DUF2306 domain-containing protein [Hellea balneolensis]